MSNIVISKTEFDRAKNYLIQFLRDSGYTGSLASGTAAYDILINGLATVYGAFKQEADKVKAFRSIEDAKAFKDLLGVDYDKAIDSILSNWFILRRGGIKASGEIALYFAKILSGFTLTKGVDLFDISGVSFTVTSDYSFNSSDFSPVSNPSTGLTEYRVVCNVEAVNNVDSTPEVGDKVVAFINDVSFVRGEVSLVFSPGSKAESSEKFIQRADKAINTRELISDRAISTVLLNDYPEVKSVYVAGYGSQEQQRDVVSLSFAPSTPADITFHMGNKADIYIQTEYKKTNYLVQTKTVDQTIYFPEGVAGPINFFRWSTKIPLPTMTGVCSKRVPSSNLSFLGSLKGNAFPTDVYTLMSNGVYNPDTTTGIILDSTPFGEYRFYPNFTGFDPDLTYTEVSVLVYAGLENNSTASSVSIRLDDSTTTIIPATSVPVTKEDLLKVTSGPVSMKGSDIGSLYLEIYKDNTDSNYIGIYEVEVVLKSPGGIEKFYGVEGKSLYCEDSSFVDPYVFYYDVLEPLKLYEVSNRFLSEDKVVSYDPLVRVKYPVSIYGSLTVTKDNSYQDTNYALDQVIRSIFKKYCDNLQQGETFSVSEFLKTVHNEISGIVSLSPSFNYYFLDVGTGNTVSGPITDKFVLPTGISKQITWNTIQIVGDSNDDAFTITIN